MTNDPHGRAGVSRSRPGAGLPGALLPIPPVWSFAAQSAVGWTRARRGPAWLRSIGRDRIGRLVAPFMHRT